MMSAGMTEMTTRVHARLPETLRVRDSALTSVLGNPAPGGGAFNSLLEGPSFDRAGNLYCVDVPYGRIFKIAPDQQWEIFARYDGHPTGLKIHRDGRIFVADNKLGIISFNPAGGAHAVVVEAFEGARLLGVNDLIFSASGDLYFTDPGPSALENPIGRVFRLRTDGTLDLLLDGLAYPNGLALDPQEKALYVAVTRTLQVIRIPLTADYGPVSKCGVFVQLTGGLIGPNGLAVDNNGSLAVVQAGLGVVWLFSCYGEVIGRVSSCGGRSVTNLAYGGEGLAQMFITEVERGEILVADMKVAGRALFSHA